MGGKSTRPNFDRSAKITAGLKGILTFPLNQSEQLHYFCFVRFREELWKPDDSSCPL